MAKRRLIDSCENEANFSNVIRAIVAYRRLERQRLRENKKLGDQYKINGIQLPNKVTEFLAIYWINKKHIIPDLANGFIAEPGGNLSDIIAIKRDKNGRETKKTIEVKAGVQKYNELRAADLAASYLILMDFAKLATAKPYQGWATIHVMWIKDPGKSLEIGPHKGNIVFSDIYQNARTANKGIYTRQIPIK